MVARRPGKAKKKSAARRISLGRGWEIISEDEGKGKEFMSPRSGRVFVQVENSSESDISPLLDIRVMKPGVGERGGRKQFDQLAIITLSSDSSFSEWGRPGSGNAFEEGDGTHARCNPLGP